MKFVPLPLSGAFLIELDTIDDARGFFARSYDVEAYREHGLPTDWPQVNISFTQIRGTLRGMHYQHAPSAEAKLLRCTRGAIHDVIIDLRAGSPTFGQHHAELLDENNRRQLYIPEGFAHGLLTLRDDTELQYLHSVPYDAACQGGVNALDPALGIEWPESIALMSDRDRALPSLDGVEPL